MRYRCLILILGWLSLLMSPALGVTDPDIADVISKWHASEAKLSSIELKFASTIGETQPFYNGVWRFQGGQEYIGGTMRINLSPDQNTPEMQTQRFEFGFDGNKMMVIRFSDKHKPFGKISEFDNATFTGSPTPKRVLGMDADHRGLRMPSVVVRDQAKQVAFGGYDVIDGHQVIVVEVIGIQTSKKSPSKDARFWLDPKRDYRILRFEKYRADGEDRRWKALQLRVDQVELAQIQGQWFPVVGQVALFNPTLEPPQEVKDSMTPEQFRRLTKAEQRKLLHYVLKPRSGGPPDIIRVDRESVTLNKKIPISDFQVQFPDGTTVYDTFIDQGYVIGKEAYKNIADIDKIPLDSPDLDTKNEETKSVDDKPRSQTQSVSTPETEMNKKDEGGIAEYWLLALIGILTLTVAVIVLWARKKNQ